MTFGTFRTMARRSAHGLFTCLLFVSACSDSGLDGGAADGDADAGEQPDGDTDTHRDADERGDVDADRGTDGDADADADTDADEELCHPGDGPCMVPMGDGVRLATRIFLPHEVPPGGVPTLIERNPYHEGDSAGYFDAVGPAWTALGYAYVGQDCRGTGDSEGQWYPYHHDIRDGGDLVSWVVEQPWCNGHIGTIGGSYTAFTALATAAGSPVVEVVFADAPAESEAWALVGGVINTNTLSWLNLVDRGEWFPFEADVASTNTLTPASLDTELLGYQSPLWQAMMEEPTPEAAHWSEHGLAGHYADICAPVLVVDNGEMTAQHVWSHLNHGGCPGYLSDYHYIVAPGEHTHLLADVILGVSSDATRRIIDFLGHHLRGAPEQDPFEHAVYFRAHDEDDDSLRPADAFPPSSSSKLTFYLGPGGTLTSTPPLDHEAHDTMSVDPMHQDPCTDAEMLVFESAPLETDITVVGYPEPQIWLSTTGQDADLFVVLVVEPDDAQILFSHQRARYRDGYDAPAPIEPSETFMLSMPSTFSVVQHVQAGSVLRLYVGGSMCEYVENPHTCEPLDAQTQWLSTTIDIYHGASHPSRIVLPIVE